VCLVGTAGGRSNRALPRQPILKPLPRRLLVIDDLAGSRATAYLLSCLLRRFLRREGGVRADTGLSVSDFGRFSQSLTRWPLNVGDRHRHGHDQEPELHHSQGLVRLTGDASTGTSPGAKRF